MRLPFVFLIARGLKNRVLLRIKRLRQPKYLISLLAGLAYLAYLFFQQRIIYQSGASNAPVLSAENAAAIETGFACMLLLAVLSQWFFLNTRTPLFTEPEIQFLFPAPIQRGTLLNYRIAKAQTGIIFGVLISYLLFSGLTRSSVFLLITVWLVYSLLFLYRISLLILRQTLDRMRNGRTVRAALHALVLLAIAALLIASSRSYPPPPASDATPEAFFAWLAAIFGSGPVHEVLLPFRWIIRPAFAAEAPQFLVEIAPVLGLIAALYLWLRFCKSGFEGAALGKALSEHSVPGERDGPVTAARKSRRPPFRLAPAGFAPIAIYWKNLSLCGEISLSLTVPALFALTLVSIVAASSAGESVSMMLGAAAIAVTGFLTIMGPVLFRVDLRVDLNNVELLKAYPVPGWGIVFGEVLGPATVIAFLQWALVLFAAGVLPSIQENPWKLSHRVSVALAAALVLPCLSLIGVLVQNAVVMLLPGWMHLGREHQKGVEAMGQRLIAGMGTVLALLVAAIPAAALFLTAWAAGYWLIGIAVIPLGALLASLGLLLEAAIFILYLGRLFDRLDSGVGPS